MFFLSRNRCASKADSDKIALWVTYEDETGSIVYDPVAVFKSDHAAMLFIAEMKEFLACENPRFEINMHQLFTEGQDDCDSSISNPLLDNQEEQIESD